MTPISLHFPLMKSDNHGADVKKNAIISLIISSNTCLKMKLLILLFQSLSPIFPAQILIFLQNIDFLVGYSNLPKNEDTKKISKLPIIKIVHTKKEKNIA